MSAAQRLRLFHAENSEPPAHYKCELHTPTTEF